MNVKVNTGEAIKELKRIGTVLVQIKLFYEHPGRIKEMTRESGGTADHGNVLNSFLTDRMDNVDRSLDSLRTFLQTRPADPLIGSTLKRMPPKKDVPWYMRQFSMAAPGGLRFDVIRFKTIYGLVFNLLYLLIDKHEWNLLKEGKAS